jgi:hypothetical protein
MDKLREFINNTPLVDGHCHALLQEFQETDIAQCFSEATGEAQKDIPETIAFKRGIRQVAKALGVDSTEQVVALRRSDPTRYSKLLLEKTGITQALFDDGLYGDFISVDSHPFKSPAKRIVRIERIAEDIVQDWRRLDIEQFLSNTKNQFEEEFTRRLRDAKVSPAFCGFKSIAAYRSGLDIQADAFIVPTAGHDLQKDILAMLRHPGRPRVVSKRMIDWLIRQTCCMSVDIPFQFHTGHGDSDLRLEQSNPLGLQSLIRAYPNVCFVLLHASWPFCKEASWLASSYANVYIDFGEIQPQLSRQALRQSLADVMSMAPLNKLMASTDGHCWPETYYISSLNFREVLGDVLEQLLADGDLTFEEVFPIVTGICNGNAIKLYKLKDTILSF